MKIRADPGRCVGAGLCAMNAATVFTQSEDDGTVELLLADGAVPADLRAVVLEAVDACPSRAITVVD
jgi:ferredoxin